MSKTNSEWNHFLVALAEGIDALAARVDAAEQHGPAPVLNDPSRLSSNSREILIGVGRWETYSSNNNLNHAGICLQNKGAVAVAGQRFASVTDFVLAADKSLWPAGAHTPREVFEQWTLVVEDASPDSCFGLICFLARLRGVPADGIPRAWVDYVRRWEGGDVRSTGAPFQSWGTLHNALGHSSLGLGKTSISREAGQRALNMSRAWVACLRFDLAVLRAEMPPDAMGELPGCAEYASAVAFLHYERQQYEKGLQHATRLQLSLPMRGTHRRYRLVDAYFEEEQVALGAKKVFLRTDRAHTWLKDGFTMMGLYKADEVGTGNDMTVSVDPFTGVHLEALWRELERMEDERWGEPRPCDNPRKGIAAYPDGRREDGSNAPNQPWYDEGGRYTLLGAPMLIRPEGPPGTRLQWRDVVGAAWQLYSPLRGFRVCDEQGKVCRIESLAGTTHGGKRLMIGAWLRDSSEQASLMFSPTVKRAFAACAARREYSPTPIKLEELPDEANFDWLELAGGVAVVHREGVFLLDDWRNEALNVRDLTSEFQLLSQHLATIESVQTQLKELVGEIDELVRDGKSQARGEIALLGEIATLKLRIQRAITETLPHTTDPGVLGFREVVERRWGLGRKLESINQAVAQIESTLRDYSTLRTNRIIGGLTIYGFPAVLLASFFSFSTAKIPEHITIYGRTLNLSWGGVNWGGIVVYIILVIVGVLSLRKILRRRTKGDRTD